MEKRKEKTIWKSISIGSTSAVVFVMGTSLLETGKETVSNGITEQPTPEDEKSFGEAFAEARSQKGPHASFEWRGNQYSTATKEEWESLPEAQQEEIVAHVQMPSPVAEKVTTDGVEVVETTRTADVTDDLDVSVMDEDVADADVSVLDEPSDDADPLLAEAAYEDDFGDDDVRVIGFHVNSDDDPYADLDDGDQGVYVVNIDDVPLSKEDEESIEEPNEAETDLNVEQSIDLSNEIDYEDLQPEDDGLMGEGVDSYFA